MIITLCASVFAFAPVRSLLGGMSEGQVKALMAGSSVEAYTVYNQNTAANMPDSTVIHDLAERTRDLENAFSVSVSSFVEYPESMKEMTDEQKFLEVFNMAQAISTIKGVTYLSHSSGYKPEVLFSEAYLVDNAKNKKKIADPVSDSVPLQVSRYAWLKDSRFGGNLYKIDYICYGNEVFLEISNENALKYMGFKCLEAKSLHLYLEATLAEEGVIISGLAVAYNQAPQVKVLFITVDLPSAFMTRITSLKDWFIEKIASV